MDFRRPEIIVMLCCIAVFIIAICLVWVTSVMAIIASFALVIASGIASYLAIIRYIKYKKQVEEMRYEDAYLYADEVGDLSAMDNFSYSRKVERHLRNQKFQQWLKMVTPIIICALGILLVVVSFRVVLGA